MFLLNYPREQAATVERIRHMTTESRQASEAQGVKK
jgi:hypothetical protein